MTLDDALLLMQSDERLADKVADAMDRLKGTSGASGAYLSAIEDWD